MSVPRDFGFGEEEQMLRDAARRFFQSNMPTERLHRLVAANPDPGRVPACAWDSGLWQQMAELGWTGLAVPERAGGLGMPCVAAAALAEEAGRAAFPSPLLATFHATYLLAACGSAAADAALAEIVSGAAATIAITDGRGAWNEALCGVECRDGRLSGTAPYVQDAGKATLFVVKAVERGEAGLYLVRAGAPGMELVADSIVDLTRDQAGIRFDGVAAESMPAPPGAALAAIRLAEPALFTLVAADLCGAAEWQLQSTVEYAKLRRQFDRPIGFFQAIKHPLVDFMIRLDQARSHVYNAACLIDHEPGLAARAAHMAKACASDMAGFGSSRSLQFHGGIGFTWECFVHLYFKRQLHNQMLFGDGVYHRARLAEMLIGPVAAR
jgi:alkylation response protein AidB-like acyl-CoA dehydrogenase